jgi:hypothetical protein
LVVKNGSKTRALTSGVIPQPVSRTLLRRERHAARTAFQKVHTDFLLQILHLTAQRRLRYPKLGSRFGEVQCFTHRQKISQMPQFHC